MNYIIFFSTLILIFCKPNLTTERSEKDKKNVLINLDESDSALCSNPFTPGVYKGNEKRWSSFSNWWVIPYPDSHVPKCAYLMKVYPNDTAKLYREGSIACQAVNEYGSITEDESSGNGYFLFLV